MTETATLETPSVETSTLPPEAPAESGSLSEHEAKYRPQPRLVKKTTADAPTAEPPVESPSGPARDESGRFVKTEGPVATDASPDTAAPSAPKKKRSGLDELNERLGETTRKWREDQRKLQQLEAEVARLRGGDGSASLQAPPSGSSSTSVAPSGFPKPMPRIEQFAQTEDPYGEHLLARLQWQQEKTAWEQAQQQQTQQVEQAHQQLLDTHNQRVEQFMKTRPDFRDVVMAAPSVPTSPLTEAAILTYPRGPEAVLYLAQHPELAYQLHLQTMPHGVSDATVATVHGIFESWLATAQATGSAPATRHQPAPPPLNPVRTGPMKTGDEPPGDHGSLADHERYYPHRR